MIQFDKQSIIDTLDTLGIQYKKADRKGWLSVLCPFHDDNNFGSAGINIKHGGFNCFSCGKQTNLIGIVKHVKNITGQEAIKYLKLTDYTFYKEINNRKIIDNQIHEEKVKPKYDKYIIHYDELELIDFDPDQFEYTKQRGFTKEFLKNFNIKLCMGDKRQSNRYKGYMIIPVIDETLDINLYEARKLYEYEKLKDYYKVRRANEKDLKERFKVEKKENRYNIEYNEIYGARVITRDNKKIVDEILLYLVRSKVLYPSCKDIEYTIFNREYLDINSDLYVVEGIASLPKVMKVFGQNVTAVFGSNLSNEQIQILKKFKKRIIVIPDNDIASLKMIKHLNENMDNVYVIDKSKDDKEIGFEQDIKNSQVLDALAYLVKKTIPLRNINFITSDFRPRFQIPSK